MSAPTPERPESPSEDSEMQQARALSYRSHHAFPCTECERVTSAARQQGRREGLEQAARLVLRTTPYTNTSLLADAILAFALEPKG